MNRRLTEVGRAAAAAAGLGALSALADWVWWRFLVDGALFPALVHGVAFFVAAALALGASVPGAGVTTRLLLVLPPLGLAIAAGFYPVARLVGYGAGLLVAWAAMWLGLAIALGWAAGSAERGSRTAVRAAVAAVGSGLAFWAVSDMWTAPDPTGPSIPGHFLRWTFALAPGLLALVVGREDGAAGSRVGSSASLSSTGRRRP